MHLQVDIGGVFTGPTPLSSSDVYDPRMAGGSGEAEFVQELWGA